MPRSDARRLAALIPLLLFPALACGPKLTPEEEIELLRSQYAAELKSLTVKQDPVAAAAPPSAEAMAADGATAGEAPIVPDSAPDAETAAATPGPADALVTDVRTDVILDILVSTTAQEYLPGVTLDVEHVDANRQEKDRRLLWVDTSNLARGGGIQVTHVLENVDWQAGDGFFVEVRTPIPAAERGEYREFQAD
jgi:hypothetical protein